MMQTEIINLITDDLIVKGKIYLENNLPYQISNAIYTFGDNEITTILAFIDISDNLDGSSGIIFTNNKLYSNLGSFNYDEIIKLELEKHHDSNKVTIFITTKNNKLSFNNNYFNCEKLIELLSKISNTKIEMILTEHEKITYLIKVVLDDILNDEYEDVILTSQQEKTINEFLDNLKLIDKLSNFDYNYELENLCTQAINLFDELELDSEEIDELIDIQDKLNEKNTQTSSNEEYYDDLMNKYLHGDQDTLNQMKGIMQGLGLDEEALKNKSPDEINQYIDDLCNRFGISRSQVENLAKRFNFKQ